MRNTAKRWLIDRRTRWTLVPLLVVVILWSPIGSAAVRFVSPGAAAADSLRVPILVYHSVAPTHEGQSAEQRLLDVDPTTFQRQMIFLAANRYTVIPLATLVAALQGRGSVPARSVVITFDDGWLTQYQNALPILQQMHFTATFFIITQQVGKGAKYMGLDELKMLQRAGMTIASHTRTHANLLKINDTQLRDEVLGSRQDLQKMLGITTELFAYPYGASNGHVVAAVQDAGYQAARAFSGGAWNDGGNRYRLHSVPATNDMDAFERELGATVIAARPSSWWVAALLQR